MSLEDCIGRLNSLLRSEVWDRMYGKHLSFRSRGAGHGSFDLHGAPPEFLAGRPKLAPGYVYTPSHRFAGRGEIPLPRRSSGFAGLREAEERVRGCQNGAAGMEAWYTPPAMTTTAPNGPPPSPATDIIALLCSPRPPKSAEPEQAIRTRFLRDRLGETPFADRGALRELASWELMAWDSRHGVYYGNWALQPLAIARPVACACIAREVWEDLYTPPDEFRGLVAEYRGRLRSEQLEKEAVQAKRTRAERGRWLRVGGRP